MRPVRRGAAAVRIALVAEFQGNRRRRFASAWIHLPECRIDRPIEVRKPGQVLVAVRVFASLGAELELQGEQLAEEGVPVIVRTCVEKGLDSRPAAARPFGLEPLAGVVNAAGPRQ